MHDLREGILGLFVEAARRGRRRFRYRWDLWSPPDRVLYSPALPAAFRAVVAETVPLRGSRGGVPRSKDQRRGCPVVYLVQPLPVLKFACPRGCGTMLEQRAGLSQARSMQRHTCVRAPVTATPGRRA